MEVYNSSIEEVYLGLKSGAEGITTEEAARRLENFGKNSIGEKERDLPILTFLRQFKSVPVFLLALAAVVSFILHDNIEGFAISGILLINAIIGFVQELKADDAIKALKKLTALNVKVLRDGSKQLVPADRLVPGDVIFLEAGDKVPADCRIIDVHSVYVLESALTGESVPVNKTAGIIEGRKSLADQHNMLFSGTAVTSGRASALVIATGMNTELGKIATMISDVQEQPSPLEIKVDDMVHKLSVIVLGMAVVVFVTLWLSQTISLYESMKTAVALAVAALPEGLPIILTMTAAIGIKRMVKRNVLIRRLMSVETLGSVTVICTDKTGTLTKNQMTVQKLYLNHETYDVSGDGYNLHGAISAPPSIELRYLLLSGALCNNASWFEQKVTGDPTEVALIVSAAKGGYEHHRIDQLYPRKDELEFTSERKMMSTVHTFANSSVQFTKGAPDILLSKCSLILENGKTRHITEHDRERILAAVSAYSEQALRVLGFAYSETTKVNEEGLVFIGLQAMIDPPREEVKEAIQRCKNAGIRVVMITGDHPDTAAAVAKKLDLDVKILTGSDLDTIVDLNSVIEDIVIYARVNPEHKLRIVAALQRDGHVVAMTGDGVNDAPALKKADMGVAMGITGTDVAKEASHMIITDDNFSSIVNAVEEGRNIYDNIRRFIRYQLSTNVGAILVIILSILYRLPLPLLPLQLLWINLSIDGPPALSLGLEPSTRKALQRKPRPKTEPLITRIYLIHILLGGAIMAAGTLGIFVYYEAAAPYIKATTMAFVTFTLYQFFNVLNCRSLHQSVFSIGFFTNRMALITIAIMTMLTVILVHTPLNSVFHLVPLTAKDWLIAFAVSSSILIIFEFKKLLFRQSV